MAETTPALPPAIAAKLAALDNAANQHAYAAARAALEAEIATLAQERDELRAALAEATTPDIYGDSEGVTADADDVDVLGDGLRCGDIREVWANRTLGSRWLARLPVTFDDDGDPDEIATRIFDTKDEAVAATRAARTPTGGTPT